MDCPYCSHPNSKVTNKRNAPIGVRRRRECLKCAKRFTTYETISNDDIYIIKKDGQREIFNVEKLSNGIKRAFEKRPIPIEKIDKMIIDIANQIRKKGKKEISSTTLGELVIKKIKNVDHVAYIRFASVYRDFQDLHDFKTQLEELK